MTRLNSIRTVRQVLGEAKEALSVRQPQTEAAKTIEGPALESEVLLAHSLKTNRVRLYLRFDEPLSPSQYRLFRSLIERRLSGEPVAYITGHREFYGLDLYVNRNVLIPRPETELLVEKALELARTRPISGIADIGTGSGAIAIALALTLPETKIYATDVSEAALKVAAANCEKHGAADRITLLQGDLLEPLPGLLDLIIANLPYVSEADLTNVNTHGFEPEIALDGGSDGLDVIRRLVDHLTERLRAGGTLLLEIGQGQEDAVSTLLQSSFPAGNVEVFKDLAGVGRVVAIHLV